MHTTVQFLLHYYRSTFNKGEKIERGNPYQCYFCSNYFAVKDRFNSHIKNCSGLPGIVYDFNLQNVVSFEETIKYKGEIPLTAYADFETIAPSGDYQDPENRKLFAVSYAIVFAWHPGLKLESVITERSFGHSLDELTDLKYLTAEQLQLINRKTLLQLRDAATDVSKRKSKIAVSVMFNVSLNLPAIFY